MTLPTASMLFRGLKCGSCGDSGQPVYSYSYFYSNCSYSYCYSYSCCCSCCYYYYDDDCYLLLLPLLLLLALSLTTATTTTPNILAFNAATTRAPANSPATFCNILSYTIVNYNKLLFAKIYYSILQCTVV